MRQEQYDAALAELDRVPKVELGRPDDPIPPLEVLKLRADIQIAQKKWDDSIVTLREPPYSLQRRANCTAAGAHVASEARLCCAEKELRVALRPMERISLIGKTSAPPFSGEIIRRRWRRSTR